MISQTNSIKKRKKYLLLNLKVGGTSILKKYLFLKKKNIFL